MYEKDCIDYINKVKIYRGLKIASDYTDRDNWQKCVCLTIYYT